MRKYWKNLRDMREERNINQSTIAKGLGTTQQVYSRYENGINAMPIHHLIKLCEYYHVSADHLLGLDEKELSSENEE